MSEHVRGAKLVNQLKKKKNKFTEDKSVKDCKFSYNHHRL